MTATESPLSRLLTEWTRDGLLILLTIAVLMACRGGLIASLWSYAGPQADALGVVTALVRGFPFDCRVAVLCWLPSLLFSLSVLRWPLPRARRLLRIILGAILLPGTVLLTIVDHFYFREYASQFDHFVIGFVYDDTAAILRTVWSDYPVVLAAIAGVVLVAGCVWALSRLTRWQPSHWYAARRPAVRGVLLVFFLASIVCGARGSVSRHPALSKNVAVTPDEKLLNKLVLNPISSLQNAISDFQENRAGSKAYTVDRVRAAAQRISGTTSDLADLDAYFARTADGAARPPRHIVVLVMESLSAWPLSERYRALGLAENLHALSARGLACEWFLSESGGTIYSLGPLLTGLPDAGLMQSYQPLARKPFATSLAPTFRRLGYRTRFFYSGYLSWQRLGDFVDGQGFEELHGGGTISDWTSGNEWGVEDEQLLAYVGKHQVDAVPTFDVVLTTSNHPPFSIDVFARGFPHRTMPEALRWVADDTADLRVLGHLWYSDHALAKFIERIEREQPDTLFVITGDHYGRRFINRSPDPWERTAVPCVLLGPAVAGRSLAARAGSHLDLIPTLVELCAPAGFAYHALGKDLLSQAQDTAVTKVGALSPTAAVEWNNTGDAVGVTPDELGELKAQVTDRRAVGWWWLMRGPALPPAENQSP